MDWQSSAPRYSSLCDFVVEMQAGGEDIGWQSTHGAAGAKRREARIEAHEGVDCRKKKRAFPPKTKEIEVKMRATARKKERKKDARMARARVLGECGGSVTLVGGRPKTSRSEYGCSLHAQRGDAVCGNGLRIQRKHLEDRLLTGLQDQVLREEFIDYVIAGLQEELRQRHQEFEFGLKALRDEKQRIEVES